MLSRDNMYSTYSPPDRANRIRWNECTKTAKAGDHHYAFTNPQVVCCEGFHPEIPSIVVQCVMTRERTDCFYGEGK